uniref:Macro domain-containing protein n=1 Tax=Plectus sambesii TaxID=2011161 RepID=A0A914WN10_9BILA
MMVIDDQKPINVVPQKKRSKSVRAEPTTNKMTSKVPRQKSQSPTKSSKPPQELTLQYNNNVMTKAKGKGPKKKLKEMNQTAQVTNTKGDLMQELLQRTPKCVNSTEESEVLRKLTNEDVLSVGHKELLDKQAQFLNNMTTIVKYQQAKVGEVLTIEDVDMWETMASTVALKVTEKNEVQVKKKAASKLASSSKAELDLAPLYAIDKTNNSKIALKQADIAQLAVDAVVCGTDQHMADFNMSKTVREGGKPELTEEYKAIVEHWSKNERNSKQHVLLDVGDAVITCGYTLPAYYVIWVSVPLGSRNLAVEILYKCYMSALDTAEYYACKTILQTIVFCTYKATDTSLYRKYLPRYFPVEQTATAKKTESKKTTLEFSKEQINSISRLKTSIAHENNPGHFSAIDLSNAQNITDVLFFALQKGAKKT